MQKSRRFKVISNCVRLACKPEYAPDTNQPKASQSCLIGGRVSLFFGILSRLLLLYGIMAWSHGCFYVLALLSLKSSLPKIQSKESIMQTNERYEKGKERRRKKSRINCNCTVSTKQIKLARKMYCMQHADACSKFAAFVCWLSGKKPITHQRSTHHSQCNHKHATREQQQQE